MVTRRHAAVAAAVWVATLWSIAAANESPVVAFRPERCSDFMVTGEGRAVVLPMYHQHPVMLWGNGKWTEAKGMGLDANPRQAVEVAPGKWAVLCWQSQDEATVYECDGTRLTRVATIAGKFDHPSLHVDTEGAIWVLSRKGFAHRLKDGKREMHEFGGKTKKHRDHYSYPPTLGLDVAGVGTWFWSYVEQSIGSSSPAIKGFEVYANGEWRKVPLFVEQPRRSSRRPDLLGGVALADDGRLLCGTRYAGFVALTPEDGTHEAFALQMPEKHHCAFLHRTRDDRLLMVADSRYTTYNKDGLRGKLMEIEGDFARELIDGMDFGRSRREFARALAETPEGVFVATSWAGLAFVGADGEKGRLIDWRHGFPLGNVTRLRVHDDHLYCSSREQGFAIVDWRELLAAEPVESDWELIATRRNPAVGPDGSVWVSTISPRYGLRRYQDGQWEDMALPQTPHQVRRYSYLAYDTTGRLWLINGNERYPSAVFEGEVWTTFPNQREAYATIAADEKGNAKFAIGKPTDQYYPAFAGDGRVAFRDGNHNISYFDGKAWRVSDRRKRIDGRSPDTPPFFVDGKLTVRAGGNYYQGQGSEWSFARKNIEMPYEEFRPDRSSSNVPSSFPGDRNHMTVRLRDSTGTLWMGTPQALYRGVGDLWVKFPTAGTPLVMASGLRKVLVSASGDPWFVLYGGSYRRIAHLRPSGSAPQLAWAQAPPEKVDVPDLVARVKCTGPTAPWTLSYRLDDGEWCQETGPDEARLIQIENLPNGAHTLEARAYDGLLRASGSLKHSFAVERNYQRDVERLVKQLRSPDFAVRDRATRGLVAIGTPALPALRKLADTADDDLGWWVKAAIQGVQRGRKKAE